jgi:hypothetical protein
MTASFSLDKIHDELWDFGSFYDDKAPRIFDSFFSYPEGDLDNESGNAFKEADYGSELCENACPF